MITSALVALVEVLTAPINAVLPVLHLPAWLTTSPAATGVGTEIGNFLAPVRGFLPIDTLLVVLAAVLSLWPAIVAYLVFNWIWRHIPTVAGFGTGDG